jgi:hypothetical protein
MQGVRGVCVTSPTSVTSDRAGQALPPCLGRRPTGTARSSSPGPRGHDVRVVAPSLYSLPLHLLLAILHGEPLSRPESIHIIQTSFRPIWRHLSSPEFPQTLLATEPRFFATFSHTRVNVHAHAWHTSVTRPSQILNTRLSHVYIATWSTARKEKELDLESSACCDNVEVAFFTATMRLRLNLLGPE